MPVSEMHRSLLQEPVRKAAGIHAASAGAAHVAGRSVGVSHPAGSQEGLCVLTVALTAHGQVRCAFGVGCWHMSAEIPLAVRDSLCIFCLIPNNATQQATFCRQETKENKFALNWLRSLVSLVPSARAVLSLRYPCAADSASPTDLSQLPGILGWDAAWKGIAHHSVQGDLIKSGWRWSKVQTSSYKTNQSQDICTAWWL